MIWKVLGVMLVGVVFTVVSLGRTAGVPELERAVLTQADFEYLGAFALPREACGRSTAFGASGLALRHGAGGKLQFFTGSHRHGGDAIYEFDFPGFGKDATKYPQAKILKEYGVEIYGGFKKIKKGKETGQTHGITFDERRSRFYFSYGSWYNVPDDNEPSLGYAQFQDDKITEQVGPWRADAKVANNQRIRGGTVILPDWFATNYTDGRRLAVGFGGYYSGVSACSRGPFLAAAKEPNDSDTELDVLPLINHTEKNWGERDTDYKSEVDWSPNPKNGVGFWGLYDEIFGACVWIDLPDKHGLLYASNMGHGRVWYEVSERWAERLEIWWWIYNPKDLADVALGKKQPHEPRPKFWKVDYQPRQHRPENTGLAFDPETRTLFVIAQQTMKDGLEYFPVVHGYRIKK
jgi:hypothetical protein